MLSVPTLQTERLTLRPLDLELHCADIFKMYSDPQAMKFVPYMPHSIEEQTHVHFEEKMKIPDATFWVICRKGKEEVIGVVNYLGGTAIPGLGYIIRRDTWGQGITVEAVQVALTYGFKELGLDRVELWIDESNLASQRVAQKLGFGAKARMPFKYSYATEYISMTVYGMRSHVWLDQPTPAQPPRFFRAQTVLMVHDIEESTRFYQDQLGFNLDFVYGDPPVHAGVSRGEWSGSNVVIQMTKVPTEQPLVPSSYLYIFVDEKLDQLCQTYRARGVEITQPPESFPWGMREFSIRDNNGYTLRFGMNV